MRVGIITIADFNNYGNRLQNYALQRAVNNLGHSSVSYAAYVPQLYKKGIKYLFLEKKDETIKERILDIRKLKHFIEFDKKNVRTIPVGNTIYPQSLNDECDIFIAGSDQIWNPDWCTEYSFLCFAEDKKKTAYAASFGCDEIPKNLKEQYGKWLVRFKKISVREITGVRIVRELTDCKPTLVLDPTMLLASEDWCRIEKKPAGIPKNQAYILNYFLGGMTEEQKRYVNNLSQQHNMKVINLLDRNMPKVFTSGPGEFIYLIHHAGLVCTDSFHASVFSVLFHVPFLVFDRNGRGRTMGNRIDTLLNITSLSERKNNYLSYSEVFNISFENTDKAINKEKGSSLKYLEMILNEDD